MAKKHSSKTATEKSIQASEPRVVTYRGWKGVNIADAPLNWLPLETGKDKFRTTDLPANYLMLQNNLQTTQSLGIETRPASSVIGTITGVTFTDPVSGATVNLGNNWMFTGVVCMYRHWLFCVAQKKEGYETVNDIILYHSILDSYDQDNTWQCLKLVDPDGYQGYRIGQIGFYEGRFIATARSTRSSDGTTSKSVGKLFQGKLTYHAKSATVAKAYIDIVGLNYQTMTEILANQLVCDEEITKPAGGPTLALYVNKKAATSKDAGAGDNDNHPIRVQVCYTYTNRVGVTLASDYATIYVSQPIETWSSAYYLRCSGTMPASTENNRRGVTGVDLYARDTENTDWVFIGHVNRTQNTSYRWYYNWYGNMTDITQWLNSPTRIPTENTTLGPNAQYFSVHDSRMYFWGVPGKAYRLYIGGNPGAELSIARGLGGAWVDIEPGSGYEIKGTAKWKTVSGANIVTVMCGNPNTNKVKRFNLIETNITINNEISYKGYSYEEVSNVVGCRSRYGFGVYDDGLYSISRYGLTQTTMAMEYNSQMKSEVISDVIAPVFEDRYGYHLDDARMCCINGVIYIVLNEGTQPVKLSNVILCYDIALQAWYTFTCDQTHGVSLGNDADVVKHIFPVDSQDAKEGLGVMTATNIYLYPVTHDEFSQEVPAFQVLLESGEMMPSQPTAFWYIQQLEFHFDYLRGNYADPAQILVEGVDYYGRQFVITKNINIRSRGHHGLAGIQRDYYEWIRVDKYVRSFRIRIKGRVRFRLTHINCKCYQQADTIGTPYGFDAHDMHYDIHGRNVDTQIHHYINDYNDLRRAVVT